MSARPSSERPDWHTLIRATVRECLQTWKLQARSGPVTPKAMETIVARATVLLMSRLDGQPPHLVMALLPGLLRDMLAAFVEAMAAEKMGSK